MNKETQRYREITMLHFECGVEEAEEYKKMLSDFDYQTATRVHDGEEVVTYIDVDDGFPHGVLVIDYEHGCSQLIASSGLSSILGLHALGPKVNKGRRS